MASEASRIQKALSEMSREQSNFFQKYGRHDPILQRRIDALRLRVKKKKKKKTKTA